MQFASPEAFYLWLLLPALWALMAWSNRRRRAKIAAMGDETLIARLTTGLSPRRDRVKQILFLSGLFFLVIALARPQWGQRSEEVVARGVDLFLLLDTSFSMDATDVAPSRMQRAQYIAASLMERLQGNRMGVIVFSGIAFTQCPLTLDYSAARIFLDTVATGIVPEPGTNVQVAVDAALRGFERQESRHRVIVLLTDGEQHQGASETIIDSATEASVVIHAVGVGTAAGEPIPILDDDGAVSDYIRDESGQPVLSKLDETTLSEIALGTGGSYYRLSDRDEEIEALTAEILAMEGDELESQLYSRYQEQFHWPLTLALAFLGAEAFIRRRVSGAPA